jgi:hypothetical protein
VVPVQSASSQALTRNAVALHKLRRAQRPPLAVVRRSGDGRLLAVIDAADQRVHTMRSPEQLVDDLASGQGELGVMNGARKAAPNAGAQFSDESLMGLCWQVGARLGRDVGLAPWLSASTSYRLVRRPDAADLGNDADATRLVELMAKRDVGVAALVDMAQVPHRTVYQLMNSLSLCGLLSSGPAPRERSASTARTAHRVPRDLAEGAWLAQVRALWQRLHGRLERLFGRLRGR